MTRRSIVELLAQADATIEDNVTGAITPSDVRAMIKDFLDTMSPSYGAIGKNVAQSIALSATPAVITTFQTNAAPVVSEFVSNLAAGTIARSLLGVAGATTRFTISGTVTGPQNNDVTVTVYKNGAPTPFACSVSIPTNGDTVSFNISGLDTVSADCTYDLRAVATSNAGYTFNNVIFICENVPRRTFI